eukprot:TRINITY_DN63226_c1_g1_i1.p1 TRINITY_DN63226_c1_g1~~TRINITY_DN63226_c1_g1_i1.p1  ORF type:complete len:554 (+),score=161.48 TRINITY_DN63226_c1_g1_i1:218-1879(+)
MKRGFVDSRGQGGPPAKRTPNPSRARFAAKLLCPDNLVLAILGRNGTVKDQWQEETGTKLIFSNKNDYFPGTTMRPFAIFADDQQCLFALYERVLHKVVELGQEERRVKGPAGSDLLGKEEGEFCLRLIVTKDVSGEIIGPHGASIQRLRADSGAKVFIDNETHVGQQMVRVIGSPDSIMTCLEAMAPAMLKGAGTEAFNAVAGYVNFSEPPPSVEMAPAPVVRLPARKPAGREVHVVPPPRGAKGDSSGRGGRAAGHGQTDRLRQLTDVVKSLPEGAADLAYSITCEFPSVLVDLVEERQQIEDATGASLTLDDEDPAAGGDVPRTVSVVGGLMSCYAAHMLIIQRAQELEGPAPNDEDAEALGDEEQQLDDDQAAAEEDAFDFQDAEDAPAEDVEAEAEAAEEPSPNAEAEADAEAEAEEEVEAELEAEAEGQAEEEEGLGDGGQEPVLPEDETDDPDVLKATIRELRAELADAHEELRRRDAEAASGGKPGINGKAGSNGKGKAPPRTTKVVKPPVGGIRLGGGKKPGITFPNKPGGVGKANGKGKSWGR